MLCPIPVLGCIGHLDTLGHLGSPWVTLGHLGSPWEHGTLNGTTKCVNFQGSKSKSCRASCVLAPDANFRKLPMGRWSVHGDIQLVRSSHYLPKRRDAPQTSARWLRERWQENNVTSSVFPSPFWSFCTFQEHEHVGCLWFLQNQVWDVGDEYHDDEDPGYRIREIYEAQSLSICMNSTKYHEPWNISLLGSTANPAACRSSTCPSLAVRMWRLSFLLSSRKRWPQPIQVFLLSQPMLGPWQWPDVARSRNVSDTGHTTGQITGHVTTLRCFAWGVTEFMGDNGDNQCIYSFLGSPRQMSWHLLALSKVHFYLQWSSWDAVQELFAPENNISMIISMIISMMINDHPCTSLNILHHTISYYIIFYIELSVPLPRCAFRFPLEAGQVAGENPDSPEPSGAATPMTHTYLLIIWLYNIINRYTLMSAKLCQIMLNCAKDMPIDQRPWSIESRRSHNTLTILAWVPGNQSSATDDQHLDVSGRCYL